ncbi:MULTISPECIES: hypothetical protein [Nitrosomonas]|uniref:Uncharacterized protein n=1 Tax=Nitrosomonas communis TaxID=44574 RepID=A0A0F7KEK5_9PROT|nr:MULTISPECIES: hypothetical protein [Nitrosomonas]AKH37244.1 hypothetical protein AAW31_04550 [Nitrosomonas communis]TYP71042.1 hypothetical protein BCL69_11164 [Nitrosomonas communis]UVS62442.1 hypothetical protein NX761_04725 [Nitrosomonas sp. PLL12]
MVISIYLALLFYHLFKLLRTQFPDELFFLIAAELNKLAKGSSISTTLQKEAISVMKSLVPFGAKLLINGINNQKK